MLERTTNTFDLAGRQIAETNPRGFITTTVYDANGWGAATIDALSNRTSFAYDNVGQEIAVQDALGNIITTIYSAQRQPLVTINPLGLRTTITYDALGRKLTETNPLGELTTTIYDAVGNVLTTINPLGNRTSNTYDVINQQISQEDAEGNTSETIYDLAGNVITSVNANDDRTSFVYNAANYKMAQIDAKDHRTTYGYDPDGLLTSIENPLGEITSMSYDIASRKKAQVDPLGRITSYTYNSNGQEIGRQYSDSTRVTMSYDANGNRIQLQDTTGDTNYAYDALDRTESVTNPDSQTVTYSYDAVSNRTLMVDPDAGQFTYSYDNLYRVETIQNPEGDSTSFVYDDANRPITKYLANGCWASFTYDAAGQVTNLFHLKSDNNVFSAFTYTYDKTGNRTQVVEDTGDRVTWTYDDTYQLTREHRSGTDAYNVTYTYDPVGNRLTSDDGTTITTYVYDEANRTKTTDDGTVVTTYSFDAAGNQRTVEDSDGVTTYTWDLNNQNTGVEKPNGDLFTFTYNGDMVRVQSEDPNGTTKFIYDEQNVLLETDDLDATQVVYTLNPREFGNLISRYDVVAADSDIYHYDALGSTVALTDSSEVETDTYVYYAFGKIKSSSGTTDQPYQWVGQIGYYAEPELDRYHIRRRDFGPGSGRFLSQDPVRDDKQNLYRYVKNNVVNESDPSGLYDEAGHFYTTYIVAIIVGYSADDAFKLAYYSQLPDEVGEHEAVPNVLDIPRIETKKAVGEIESVANPSRLSKTKQQALREEQFAYNVIEIIHSLHGGGPKDVRIRKEKLKKLIIDSKREQRKIWEVGYIIHAFGDAYAHTFVSNNQETRVKQPLSEKDSPRHAFSAPLGHLNTGPINTSDYGHAPDIIPYDIENYVKYVNALAEALAKRRGGRVPENKIKLFLDKVRSTLKISYDGGKSARSGMRSIAWNDYGYKDQKLKFYDPEGASKRLESILPTPTYEQVEGLVSDLVSAIYARDNQKILERTFKGVGDNVFEGPSLLDLFKDQFRKK
ncbi:RHS repeat domain-containing protein [Gimesia chilikensis]|uniref:tRNA3(Ser)-specific nuclease WapA n=1 Tax=Gimesia chilikensis TaxID=2605989 RepID=A0A517PSQ0_9PLAN|nr:DUF6765 family protein [Gimesia chilikensis]QDT22402.1 tRNA3(Ser)-specific nuclease WapA precursor [Gimesia chilikensis]